MKQLNHLQKMMQGLCMINQIHQASDVYQATIRRGIDCQNDILIHAAYTKAQELQLEKTLYSLGWLRDYCWCGYKFILVDLKEK